jgi:hypothetical protein
MVDDRHVAWAEAPDELLRALSEPRRPANVGQLHGRANRLDSACGRSGGCIGGGHALLPANGSVGTTPWILRAAPRVVVRRQPVSSRSFSRKRE